jgi:hypothetical protein
VDFGQCFGVHLVFWFANVILVFLDFKKGALKKIAFSSFRCMTLLILFKFNWSRKTSLDIIICLLLVVISQYALDFHYILRMCI